MIGVLQAGSCLPPPSPPVHRSNARQLFLIPSLFLPAAGPAQACFLRHAVPQQQQRQQQQPQPQPPLPQLAWHRPRSSRLHAAADEAGPAPTSSSDLGVQQAAGGLQARLAALGAFLDALYR